MIIRRFTDSIKSQDWSMAMVEILIVVIGIFAGLQVDDWNNDRKDRILEREYLERLYDDMTGTLEDYASNDNWDDTRLESQRLVLEVLRSGQMEESQKEEFAAGILLIGIHNPIRRRWGTVEELKSTGNISLLQDIELRNLIALTEGSYNRLDRINAVQENQITQFRTIIMQHVYPVVTSSQTGGYNEADYDFEELVADKAFINAFAGAHLSSEIIVGFIKAHLAEIVKLRDKIGELLGKEKPQ